MTVHDNERMIAVIQTKLENVIEDAKNFVTKDRFAPIEKIVWTIVFLLITSVIGAGLALIFK